MNKPAEQAITAMLNCFPQTNQDYGVFLRTLAALLDGTSDQAVIDAAKRFASGDVMGQSKTFAPSGPEFIQEARSRQEAINILSRPKVEHKPRYVSHDFLARLEGVRARNAHRPILKEDVAMDEAHRAFRNNEYPLGSSWVACLGIIYGPEPSRVRQHYTETN